jgi:hypothetical protein
MAAAMASPVSSPLIVDAAGRGEGRGAAGAGAGRALWPATEGRGAPLGGGATLAGALGRAGAAVGACEDGGGEMPGADGGAPVTDGSLIVAPGFAWPGPTGPAEGLGGKLMRTVSFLG